MEDDNIEAWFDAALTFGTFVAFALPQFGLPLAGVIAAGQGLWHHYRSVGSDAGPQIDIRTAIAEELYSDAVQSSTDRIRFVARDLSVYFGKDALTIKSIPHNLEAELKAHPHGPVANFYDMLRRVIHEGELDPAIDALLHSGRTASTTRDVIGLPTFLQGVSTYLAVYTVMTLVEHHGCIEFDRSKGLAVRERLKSWIDHLGKTADKLNGEIAQRLACVSEVEDNVNDTKRSLYQLFEKLKGMFSAESSREPIATAGMAVYFTDSGSPVPGVSQEAKVDGEGYMLSIPNLIYGCRGQISGSTYSKVEEERTTYLSNLSKALRRQRANFNSEAVAKILADWRTALLAIDTRLSTD